MDLTNKQIRISRLVAVAVPPQTSAHIDVVEEIAEGVRKTVASYELVFPEMWSNPADPLLLAAVTEKLNELP
jgi:hypothetical protein